MKFMTKVQTFLIGLVGNLIYLKGEYYPKRHTWVQVCPVLSIILKRATRAR